MPSTSHAALTLALIMAVGAFLTPGSRAGAQAAQTTPATAPEVGQEAPDFTAPGATRYGLLRTPVKLSDYRGQTVVLAFFYKARTKGWTVQMEAYRDQYAKLFNNGKNVVVIAMSVDPDTTLASWARDEGFPVLFASDVGGSIGQRYGVFNPQAKMDTRVVFVIGPDGKITYRAMPFRELTEGAYTELGEAVGKTVASRGQ